MIHVLYPFEDYNLTMSEYFQYQMPSPDENRFEKKNNSVSDKFNIKMAESNFIIFDSIGA